MIPYQIRSIQLLNLVRDIKNGSLVPNAYFQRNLVWRDVHKKDLIKTILLGYPFPMIFISQGEINIENMTNVSCIVDGQQRCDAITSFVEGKFQVDGQYFHELTEEQKTKFFKYEIPVCELDIMNTDDRVLEIFKRINRTSNSLTNIEKISSEYGASYFMMVAKLLSTQWSTAEDDSSDDLTVDPNIPEDFKDWAKDISCTNCRELMVSNKIFSPTNIARKVNLQYVLNLMCTFLDGFYTRNDNIETNLELYLEDFPNRNRLVDVFESVSQLYLSLSLPKSSVWNNKANFFSLFICLSNAYVKHGFLPDSQLLKEILKIVRLTEEYKIAAKEGVNNKKERVIRNDFINEEIIHHLYNI